MEKSRIYFSANVDGERKEEICGILGFQSTNTFGKYLGYPIKNKGVGRGQFNFVVKKVMERLVGWKTKFLSLTS